MRILLLTFYCCSITFIGVSQNQLKKNWYKGNVFYDNAAYEDAAYYYQNAVDESPLNYKANYNLGNASFKLKDFEKAVEQYEKIAEMAPSANDKAWTYHNLGNAYFATQKLEDAIEAYKKALRLNPKDEETRYNLAYAQLLKKEQDKQNENQKNQPNDQKKQDDNENKDDQKDDNQKDDKNKDNKNDPGEDGKDTDQKDNEGDQKNDPNEGDKQDKGEGEQPKPKPSITKEEARRILEAAGRKEKQIQKDLDKEKVLGTGKPEKIDW